ncbi:MAG: type II toxin-antitoxin system VapC family toxin [Roseiarcus sp.]|uniref:type II toxin-antitoxin system VapC family toxin n=1 Tax=Roseiarcus sp. TaxID=1969460 RepID=UPI003C4CC206
MGPLIFIDTSVFVAILASEGDRADFEVEIQVAARCLTSGIVRLETSIVLASKVDISPRAAEGQFEKFLMTAGVEEIAVDKTIARRAVECFEKFGRGRHPARLNFADCLSYACAKAHGANLLYKGDDFTLTDVNKLGG